MNPCPSVAKSSSQTADISPTPIAAVGHRIVIDARRDAAAAGARRIARAGHACRKRDCDPRILSALAQRPDRGCNQKTNRDPVTAFPDDEVREVLERLRHRGLSFARTGAGSRVEKFGSRLQEQFNFGRGELAIIIEFMLRGPQTVNELRARTERMHRFDDTDQVEHALAPSPPGLL